ncbi:hypothetical protein V6Z11_A04G168400 [Gossypium hirsutum]
MGTWLDENYCYYDSSQGHTLDPKRERFCYHEFLNYACRKYCGRIFGQACEME